MLKTQKRCDCFECSAYCLCGCHKQPDYKGMTQAMHKKVMTAFDELFDLVRFHRPISKQHLEELCLTQEALIKIGNFILDKGYRANNSVWLTIPETRGTLQS